MRFGGSGGQGVVLAARLLGEAAVLDGKNVLQTQAYGAEARGSMTKSEVIISDSRINFPAVRESDVLVAMSQEAADALVPRLKGSGTLVVDSGSVKEAGGAQARVYRLPMTEAARRSAGEALYANMVMLGALVAITSLVTPASMEKAITEKTGRRSKTNVEAFRIGLGLPAATVP